MNANLRLLKHPAIFHDESLQSYIARISLQNHYQYPTTVEKLAEQRSGRLRDFWFKKYCALSELTNQPIHLLIRAGNYPYLDFKSDLVQDWLLELDTDDDYSVLEHLAFKTGFKKENSFSFCPKCLETPYHRTHWLFPYTNICIDHLCLLLDRCPNCEEPLQIHHLLTTTCGKCEFNFLNSPIIDVSDDEWGVNIQATLQKFIGSKISAEFEDFIKNHIEIRNTSLTNWLLDFISNNFNALSHDSTLMHTSIKGVDKGCFTAHHRSYIISATVFRILSEWPQGYYRLIDAFRHRFGRELTDPEEDIGAFGSLVISAKPLVTNVILNELLDNFIFQSYKMTGFLALSYRFSWSEELRNRYPYVSELELARMWLLSETHIQSLIERGYFVDSAENPIPWETRYENVMYLIKSEEISEKFKKIRGEDA